MKRLVMLCLWLLPVAALAEAVDITEWPVPWENTRPRDPDVGPQGRVWFVGQTGDYVASLDPETGEFRRFPLDSGTGPHNLIVGGDGIIWYAGNRAAHIGRLDPETGRIAKYPMPDPAAGDPHTLVFDGRGQIWFTVQFGNFVGRFAPDTGKTDLIPVPTPRARPYGIVTDGVRPWFVEFASHKLGTVDPETLELREIELPRREARPRRLAMTSDGSIWYVDYVGGFLGRHDPKTGETREWPMPSGKESLPYAMAADDKDRLWFAETGPSPNRLVGFDPASGEFFSVTEIKSGGGAVRHMVFHKPTRSLWFGTDANTVGRARLP